MRTPLSCPTIRVTSTYHTMRLLVLLAVTILSACTSSEPESETRPTGQNVLDETTLKSAASGEISFTEHVKPILEAKCAMCHNQSGLPGHLSFASREAAIKTGTLGIFIVPGHPQKSKLFTHLTSAHASVKAMPPVGQTLTSEETALLTRWISQGAHWPAGEAGNLITEG
jgi:uncharacterized membrane protein